MITSNFVKNLKFNCVGLAVKSFVDTKIMKSLVNFDLLTLDVKIKNFKDTE